MSQYGFAGAGCICPNATGAPGAAGSPVSNPLHFTSSLKPVLTLGLIGFAPLESQRIVQLAKEGPVRGIQWSLGDFADSDAWLASGARTRVLAHDEVAVDACGSASGEAAVRFWLPKVDRPIAFSRPFACKDFEPACSFDANSASSVLIVLAKFANWLRPRAVLLYLADLLTRHAGHMRKSRVYHVMAGHRLVAVVDLKGDVGVLPDVSLAEIAKAAWLPRPDSAAYIPDNFARRGTRELLWEYATRTERDLLPASFRTAAISLRTAPLLSQHLLTDAQLFVLRELKESPRTLRQLCAPGRFSASDIARALMALYVVGSVTSAPARAAAPDRYRDEPATDWPWLVSSGQEESAV